MVARRVGVAAALHQNIGRAHAPEIRHQREGAVVARHDAIDIGDRQREARALQQRAHVAQIGKRRDARRDPTPFAFGFRGRRKIAGSSVNLRRRSSPPATARRVSPRVAPFADLRDVGALLQRAGFAAAGHRLSIGIVAPLRQRLRADGGSQAHGRDQYSGGRRRTPTRRATMLRMAQIYGERFCRRGRPHPRHFRCDLAVRLGTA